MHAQGIDEPWTTHSFIDQITHLQRIRLLQSSCALGEIQFHDRSIFCTAALSDYLGRPRSMVLSRELERVVAQRFYQPEAFFIRGLGFIEPTAARRISLEDAIRFERVHEQVYRDFGFQLVLVEPGAPMDRANRIKAFLREKVNLPSGE
jgi:predicted ATPase